MTPEEIEAMKAENAKLKSESDARKKADEEAKLKADEEAKKKAENDNDLISKAKKEKDEQAAKSADSKKIENALKFSIALPEFLKNNEGLVPAEFGDIVNQSKKETYDSSIQQSNDLKANFIRSFFSNQANLDLLTEPQKNSIDEFLKLSKNGREDKASEIYENIFEPTLEMSRRIKKASEVSRANAGYATGSSVEEKYKARMIELSKKAHLNEKAV